MKKQVIAILSVLSIFGASCNKKTSDDPITTNPPVNTNPSGVDTVSGDISSNRTFSANRKYLLKGFVYVTNGATLTIEAGTVIMGDKATKGTLTVTRGAKINAVGTADKPIIFTSALPVGARSAGDWGGIILLGKAKVNAQATNGEAKIEGGLVPTDASKEKDYIYFGGTDDADNSGTMKYVRIEFGGVAYSVDNEINGLTMGGVGNGTTLSYIQVYRSGDDAFEWFGGSVNADHLIATYSLDDDFDTDNGFSGHVQFCVSQRAPKVADQSGSNGFESDNDANGSSYTPQTTAMFSNMTIVGPIATANPVSNAVNGLNANYQNAAQIRRNSSQSIFNSILIGFPVGLYIDDSKYVSHKTSQNVSEGNLKFRNNIIAGCVTRFKFTGTAFDSTYLPSTNTTFLDSAQFVGMNDAYKFSVSVSATAVGRPNYLLKSNSPAASGADFNGTSGFQSVSYRGAFDGSNDWTTGWANFDAENKTY